VHRSKLDKIQIKVHDLWSLAGVQLDRGRSSVAILKKAAIHAGWRGRAWKWFVSTTQGVVVICGSEGRRSAAWIRRIGQHDPLVCGPAAKIKQWLAFARCPICVAQGIAMFCGR
jgi:hypothetical protein